ncbi:MAG: hypothetical protein KF861_18220 [Planctomycetaceae bacterium]|nr:hypothetical protein [Planctomycetaceae bacterium]
MMNESETSLPSGPWPAAVGLLAACATTMFGIVGGCEPETILYRGFVSGVTVTVVATVVRSVWHLVDPGEAS